MSETNGKLMTSKLSREEAFHRILDILGCKWTLAILEATARGINRPSRLKRELNGLTTKVLNERIRKLERFGVIVRYTYPEIPPRVEYEFPEQGRQLLIVIRAVNEFVDQWQT
jgi:DNA-binding HxlR family transcriptional regulator